MYISGLVQDCNISIANVLEILQSCTKPLICVKDNSFETDLVYFFYSADQTQAPKTLHCLQIDLYVGTMDVNGIKVMRSHTAMCSTCSIDQCKMLS